MLLIPIGHEQDGVRRAPLVTLAILGLCLVAFLLSLTAESGGGSEQAAWEAVEYYFEHPYLQVDSEFKQLSGEPEWFDGMADLIGTDFEPPSAGVVAEEQAHLDGLVREALQGVDGNVYQRFGLVPARWNLVSAITSMFMHAGWLHLFGNLLILYLAAPYIEDVWGRGLFAGLYLVGGVVAAMAHVIANPQSEIPLVGASGAIAAVMGAFLIRFSRTQLKFFWALGILARGTFDAPAWVMLPLWFGQQVFLALIVGSDGGVAYLAHIGGFVFGCAVGLAVRQSGLEERVLEPALTQASESTVLDNSVIEEALALHEQQRSSDAVDLLLDEVRRRPTNWDAIQVLWDVAGPARRQPEAAGPAARWVVQQLRSGELDEALTLWRDVVAVSPQVPLDIPGLLRIAEALKRRGRIEEAQPVLRLALLQGGAGMEPHLALQIALSAQKVDPELCRAAAHLGLQHPMLEAEMRGRLESCLQGLGAPAVSIAP